MGSLLGFFGELVFFAGGGSKEKKQEDKWCVLHINKVYGQEDKVIYIIFPKDHSGCIPGGPTAVSPVGTRQRQTGKINEYIGTTAGIRAPVM